VIQSTEHHVLKSSSRIRQLRTSPLYTNHNINAPPSNCSITMAQIFTLFPRLPPELRLRIWNQGFPFFPRVIEVTSQFLNSDISVPNRKWSAMASSILTLLQINHEARNELLPRYSAPFSLRNLDPYSPAFLLINYEIDTIYFRVDVMAHISRDMFFEHIFEAAEGEMRSNLTRLAGNDRFWRIMIPTNSGTRSAGFRGFDNFLKLEEVTVVGYLEQRLEKSNGLPRLGRLEACEPRDTYEATYLPWFKDGLNSIAPSIPRTIKLCKEIAKIEQGSAL
jgi:hypothetical protein